MTVWFAENKGIEDGVKTGAERESMVSVEVWLRVLLVGFGDDTIVSGGFLIVDES